MSQLDYWMQHMFYILMLIYLTLCFIFIVCIILWLSITKVNRTRPLDKPFLGYSKKKKKKLQKNSKNKTQRDSCKQPENKLLLLYIQLRLNR